MNLVILDPSLRSANGHFLTYDKAISDEARKSGVRTIVLGSTKVDSSLTDPEIRPCFRFGLEAPEPDAAIARAFLGDLIAATRQLPHEGKTVFFLHTTTYRQIEPAITFIAREMSRDFSLIILLRYVPSPNPAVPNSEGVHQYGLALSAIDRLGVADRVRLVTDSDLLACEYRTITRHSIEIVPIPHVGGAVARRPQRTLTYLGNARATKGFQYLPYMVAQIRPLLLTGDWTAEFQANVMFRRDLESVVALCELRGEPVTLWEEELSLADYDALLGRSGIVLIPYQALYYYAQTSGVLAEAIGRGKPVVVPRGTWMARQVAHGVAGVLFAPGDRVDFARAVTEAMARLEELTAAAAAMREGWVAEHNPQAFVRSLLRQA